jgi:nicotinamide mononucleotide transporter
MLVISAAFMAASYFSWWSISMTESAGFATGGVCVWLTVRENLWTWPIGLANNVVFFVLFWQARLFADTYLQVVYFALGTYGWWNWSAGGAGGTPLRVSRASAREWVGLAVFVVLGVWGLREMLIRVAGAAPFWDALTTILSLAAQYLLCRKRLENWWVWITADLIYVPLYWSRHLPLTALLYGVFLLMCVCGLREWSARWKEAGASAGESAT